MHFPKNMAILITALTELSRPHDAFATAFGADSNWNNQGVNIRAALVKVNLKSNNVVLPVSFGTPVIDIFRPMFDFLTPGQVVVIDIFLQTDDLVSESHFNSPVVIATENESGATVRLNLAVRLEWFPTQFQQSFLQTDFE